MAAAFYNLSQGGHNKHWQWLVIVSQSAGAALDVVVTICLCYYLYKQRHQTFQRSASLKFCELSKLPSASSTKLMDQLIVWTIRESPII